LLAIAEGIVAERVAEDGAQLRVVDRQLAAWVDGGR